MSSLVCKIKKTVLQLIILIFISLTFWGCFYKNKEESEAQKNLKNKIHDFSYQMTAANIAQKSVFLGVKNYCPSSLYVLLNRQYFYKGKLFYFAEDYFPEYLGSFDILKNSNIPFDRSDWVEELLLHLEEERIASSIEHMETEYSQEQLSENPEEEIKKQFNNEIQEYDYLNKNSTLTFMEYDDEVFLPQKTNDGFIIIHGEKSNITRSFYDDNYYLMTKELWNIPSYSQAELKQSEDFNYFENTSIVSEKTVTVKDEKKIISYDQEGKIKSNLTYQIVEDKPYLVSDISYSYDSENRLKKSKEIIYTWNKSFTRKTDSFEKVYIYSYNSDDIPADFEYYEDNVLKMKNKYSTVKGTYTSQVFFENDYSVKTYYENNVRMKEVFTVGGKVRRTKVYE